MAAELKIGDYHYYGWGTVVNMRKAVAHYRYVCVNVCVCLYVCVCVFIYGL